ncbi:response regulator [Tropicibacter alexandrii]|uniref:response regulator n=1 Tax=Tropicibacter alexandrii TaxID=2267683 RepID=UPI000EF498EA|nr:response regulator [Tropicibacter alexandrii]
MRVLLLEDDGIDAKFIDRSIRRAFPEAQVDLAATAEAALALITGLPQGSYDFILVDQHLPGQAGADFVRQIQQLGLRGKAVTVMMTGDLSEQARSAALACDFDTFIGKPVQVSRLTEILSGRGIYWENTDIPKDLGLYRELRKQA